MFPCWDRGAYNDAMTQKVSTAAELEKMTPAEQDEVFVASVVTDLSTVPPAFLAKVRDRVEQRVEAAEHTRSE